MKMFQCPHFDKQFSSGDAVILLCLLQHITVVGYNSLLSVLFLGEHSSNIDVTVVGVHGEPP
jgi:hypothetical protein